MFVDVCQENKKLHPRPLPTATEQKTCASSQMEKKENVGYTAKIRLSNSNAYIAQTDAVGPTMIVLILSVGHIKKRALYNQLKT